MKKLLQEIITKYKMYVEWITTPITHIHYETVKQSFKRYDKIVQKDKKEAKRI